MLEELERNISSIGLSYVSQSTYLYVTCSVDILNKQKNIPSQLEIVSKASFLTLHVVLYDWQIFFDRIEKSSNASWNEQVITAQKCISICDFISFLVIFFDGRQKEVGKMIRVRFPLYTVKPKAYFSNWAHWSKSL